MLGLLPFFITGQRQWNVVLVFCDSSVLMVMEMCTKLSKYGNGDYDL